MNTSRTHYEQRVAELQMQRALRLQIARTISLERGLTFSAGIVLVWGIVAFRFPGWWGMIAGGLAFGRFLQLVFRDEVNRHTLLQAEHLLAIQQEQIARIDRDWASIPSILMSVPDAPSPQMAYWRALSRDLDLLGPNSLFHWICRARTPRGREILRDWLFLPADPSTIAERASAARKLALDTDFREQLDLRGRLLAESEAGPTDFVAWAESRPWYASHGWVRPMARMLPILLLLSGLGGFLGWLSPLVAFVIAIASATVGLLLSVIYVGTVHDIFNRVSSRQNEVVQYLGMLDLVEQLPEAEPQFVRLRRFLSSAEGSTNGIGPRHALTRLGQIMKLARLRHSSIFGLVLLGVQITTLLDFHVLDILERWQLRHGRDVRKWLDAIGELESLASLASLMYDQPDWAQPDVVESTAGFEALELGHPLLRNAVRNDVKLGPAGTLLLVTGSNMSGKSTLLRSIGMNAVLAQMGAPVCATKCTLAPVHLATSMRIEDSLVGGVSYFMAELQRLKQIVDQARQHAVLLDQGVPPGATEYQLLFLLDEILQGTNSRERNIAVAHVLKHLLDSKAWGAVTTHDLELASNPALTPYYRLVHFRETIDPTVGKMTFDYKMRDGVATTTNAIRLLELVGLGD